jgi:hypothetical protein
MIASGNVSQKLIGLLANLRTGYASLRDDRGRPTGGAKDGKTLTNLSRPSLPAGSVTASGISGEQAFVDQRDPYLEGLARTANELRKVGSSRYGLRRLKAARTKACLRNAERLLLGTAEDHASPADPPVTLTGFIQAVLQKSAWAAGKWQHASGGEGFGFLLDPLRRVTHPR